jgi:hypothetical protein
MTDRVDKLEFPKLFYGNFSALQRRVKTEAKKWADQYRSNNTFPNPVTTDIPAGTVVWLRNASDLRREIPHWRLYFGRLLAAAINEALDWQNHEEVKADFEAFTLQFSWGALDAAVEHVVPNSIANVSRRINAVLLNWESLDSLRYIDRELQPVDLTQVMSNHFTDLLDMWLEQRSGDVWSDLRSAVDVMPKNSPDKILDRVSATLLKYAQIDQRIRNPNHLRDPDWLKERILKLDPSTYNTLTTGYVPDLLRILYILDDSISARE